MGAGGIEQSSDHGKQIVRKLAIRVAARVEWAVIVPVFSRRPLDRCSITIDPMILAAVEKPSGVSDGRKPLGAS